VAIAKIWLVTKIPGASGDQARSAARARTSGVDALFSGQQGGIAFDRKDGIDRYFVTEAQAIEECNRLASANPLVPYAVMAISDIRETGKPTVLRKQFTTEGELVPVAE
jgi:hypothetical protein